MAIGRFAWRGDRGGRRRPPSTRGKREQEAAGVASSTSDTDLPELPGWEILEKLGEGGMCAVYRVRPEAGGPECAIKMLLDHSEAARERFAREAQLLQRIDHPNVVRVHELRLERRPWLVMDLLVGRDLLERMRHEGPMDPEWAARLFVDLADGLATVHELGVRHRDIKPANIMLGDDGIPRLIDFGIARDVANAHITQKGFVVGTASYLPPEVFTEDDTRNAQDAVEADVYALGQTLWEVLTGSPLHEGTKEGTEASLLVRIMRDKLDRPHLDPRTLAPHVPDGLAEVVSRATARELAERTPSARILAEDLKRWLSRRSSAEELAPVTWMDPRSLIPLQRAAPTPVPIPVTIEPTAAPTPARPRRRWLGGLIRAVIGALGMVGMTTIAAGIGLMALVGIVLLW
ncbi:MAG TPA: serine/threonine protein kinase, partial [Deltaproteobacteria bacterium]|nr:serine/threonine protein kinase [Deltaproteobacteria bacterium]